MTEYYCDKDSGNDAWDGSQATPGTPPVGPWENIHKGSEKPMLPGDRLNIAPATAHYLGMRHNATQGAIAGTAGNPIIFEGSGPGVIIDAPHPVGGSVIVVQGLGYITLKTLEIYTGTVGSRLVHILDTDHIVMDGCIVDSKTATANTGANDIHINQSTDCEIMNCTITGNTGDTSAYHAIHCGNSLPSVLYTVLIHDNVITGRNLLFDSGGTNAGWDSCQVYNNVIHTTDYEGLVLDAFRGSNIYNNLIHHTTRSAGAAAIYFGTSSGFPATVNEIKNNTILTELQDCISWAGLATSSINNYIWNNILFGNTLADVISNVAVPNFWTSGTNKKMGADQSQANIDAFLNDFINVSYSAPTLTVVDAHILEVSQFRDVGLKDYEGRVAPTVDFEGDIRWS